MLAHPHLLGAAAAALAAAVLLASAPASADPAADDSVVGPAAAGPPQDVPPFSVGTAATDTFGGSLPDGETLTAFDVTNPVIGRMDPALLAAVQKATEAAAAEGVTVVVNSGWRSPGFQQRLFDDGVRTYGSPAAAAEFVASPETSMHVYGKAVDVGGPDAAAWMSRNGSRFGLCQVYANELWHYELTAGPDGTCPPMRPNAAG
ncbi:MULTISPECIES: M15 family metallopeptidase [Mycobacteriaceae]|uniref:M15 family metallopeptidase n=1 Tax=Mycobacteriaceae TaxID=1762 RepID=UPI0007FC44C4|nr:MULTISPECIES: M15 family metallopeptidase [Mycobacteriaceae]MCK0176978.1 M15 family metallopeptidase [Mycolicibacterium sp. F2034L]OBB62140.1 peptidase M15 [Mycobacterium sp. 852013-51886_SCH5428379]